MGALWLFVGIFNQIWSFMGLIYPKAFNSDSTILGMVIIYLEIILENLSTFILIVFFISVAITKIFKNLIFSSSYKFKGT